MAIAEVRHGDTAAALATGTRPLIGAGDAGHASMARQEPDRRILLRLSIVLERHAAE
jgi:hypothetical protein